MIKIIKIIILVVFLFIPFWQINAQVFENELNSKALIYFIEGKTQELQGNYIYALEDYKEALKYDTASGIYFAISLVYYKLDKYKESLTEINKALFSDGINKDYLLHKSNIMIRLNKVKEATDIYEQLYKTYPEDITIAYSLARIYEEQKNTERAINIYEKITDEYGFDYEVLRRMYEIYLNYKNYEKALEVIQYVLKLDRYETSNMLKYAALLRILGYYEKSLSVYKEIFAINPEDKNLQTELIKLYFLNNQPEEGFSVFANVIGKNELNYEEKVQMGEIYFNLISQDNEAITIAKSIFNDILNNYPGNWKPYFYLGAISIVENKDNYFDYFDKSLLYADTITEAYIQIAYSYLNKGNNERVISVLEKALPLSVNDFRMNYFYGMALQRLSKLDESVFYYERALETEPENVSLLSTLGLVYNTLKRYVESESMYEKALKISPDDPLVLNNYAYNLSVRGVKLDKALQMAKRAIQKDPKNANFLDTIGWIYFKLGEYEFAEDYILRSLKINSGSAVVNDHLGDVYEAMKDKTNALKYWQKAYELSPNSHNIKEKIEKYK
ncbi:MAG: tetratricopeptide repeat protein [Ignavibacteria bacterium]|nr:tetratricopeptide repeat protein [Ignavibacteria bacterium]